MLAGKRGGLIIGPSHKEGGTVFADPVTGKYLVEEGMEVNLPKEVLEDKTRYTFSGTNAQVLNQILLLTGHSLADKVTVVKKGDLIICKRAAWDDGHKTYAGTIAEILDTINTSKGCKPVTGRTPLTGSTRREKKGKKMPLKQRIRDWQAEHPNSPRWLKKKKRIQELSNGIRSLRSQVTRDILTDDEKVALTALIIAVMDRTAERVGNDDSADNGHFGVTGFQKKHLSIAGNTMQLDYTGKSGMKHQKSFSDERIARALKKAIRNSPSKFIFETYLVDILSGMGILAMIVPRSIWPYPQPEEMPFLDDWFERLFSAIRTDYGIKPFIWDTKERADEYIELKKTINEKVDTGVIAEKDKTIVEGEMQEFEKGIAFRTEYFQDAKGENRIIYRLLTSPTLQKGKVTSGIKSSIFIFALRYFTDQKSGYGIADGIQEGKPNIVKQLPDAKLEDAKRESIEYFNQKTITMNRPELFKEDGGIAGSDEQSGEKECHCFSTYLTQNHPDLCLKFLEENINQSPELRAAMDVAHSSWEKTHQPHVNNS